MAYYGPLQRKDGRWDYTCTNGAGTFPIGYCSAYRELTPDGGLFPKEMCDRENARILPFKDKYHGDGHATSEEAMACYRVHELDQHLVFDANESGDTKHKCGICG